MKYLQLNDIDCYKRSLNLSNYVWEIVVSWDWFPRKTIGVQIVNSTDSIPANIAEGFGRYTKQDKIHFYRISFGSVMKSLDWNLKAKIRKLLTETQYQYILKELKSLPKEINQLIQLTKEKLKR